MRKTMYHTNEKSVGKKLVLIVETAFVTAILGVIIASTIIHL